MHASSGYLTGGALAVLVAALAAGAVAFGEWLRLLRRPAPIPPRRRRRR